MDNGGVVASKERLRGWKEIASFFGTDVRTAKRWAATRNLPVQRVPGGTRTPVYAEVTALQNWLAASKDKAAPAPVLPEAPPEKLPEQPAPRLPEASLRPSRKLILAASAAVLIAGAAGLGVYLSAPPETIATVRKHQPPQEAVDLYLAGMFHWEQRSPESLARAAQYFSEALSRDPQYAEAYAGLANCYLLMREYTRMPPEQAYPLAEAAAQRALSLDPDLPEAHAALAFATFYWTRDFERARRSFERAVALDPTSAHLRHWHATALLHIGDIPEALAQIEHAQRLDPRSHSILADKGLVLFHAGRSAEAVALLRQVERLEPEFQSPHSYLAVIHLTNGEDSDFLRRARQAARLRGDDARLAILADAEKALGRGGRRAMLATMPAGQRRLHAEGQESAYTLAGTYALLGERGLALRYLEQSVNDRESVAVGLRIEPSFRSLRDEPVFARLSERIGTSGPVQPRSR